MPGLLSRMRTAAIVIGNLSEEPGYNGSRLVIDDTEADEIEKAIDAAVAEVERLRAELARRHGEIAYQLTKRLVIDMPTARAVLIPLNSGRDTDGYQRRPRTARSAS